MKVQIPWRLYSLALMITLGLVASDAWAQTERRYMTPDEIEELVSCRWGSSCWHDKDQRMSWKAAADRIPTRWRRIYKYLSSSREDWSHTVNPFSEPFEYYIYVPDSSDRSALFLIKRDEKNGDLVDVSKALGSDSEIVYVPSVVRPRPSARELVLMSHSKVRSIFDCSWGEECNRETYRIASQRHYPNDIFSTWRELYGTQSFRVVSIPGLTELSKYRQQPLSVENGEVISALLLEEDESRVIGAFHITPDGVELEYRLPYSNAVYPLSEYREVRSERNERSCHFSDLVDVSFEYPTSDTFRSRYGIGWGADFESLGRSKVIAGFRQQEPREFFKENVWFLPYWREQFSNERGGLNSGAWSNGDLRYFLYRRRNDNEIRIASFHTQADDSIELYGLFSCDRKGNAIVRRSPEQQVKQSQSTNLAYSSKHRFLIVGNEIGVEPESLDWYTSPFEFARPGDLPSSPSLEEVCSTSSRILVLDDPASFFQRRGFAFGQMRRRFEALVESGRHTFPPDLSWTETPGAQRYILRDACWEDRYSFSGNPVWVILEYHESRLTKVYNYDQSWEETILQAPAERSIVTELGMSLEDVRRSLDDAVFREDLEDMFGSEEFLSRESRILVAMSAGLDNQQGRANTGGSIFQSTRLLAVGIGVIVLLALLLRVRARRLGRVHQRVKSRGRMKDMGFDG